ncbi:hypothetical protein PILCRDRAFT_803227 [Piloderma croceum F 1598]|uniref:RTA1 domain protein n=1 Tax=Piloderma croceum (strain F 1598) TaxID=765440 RepID=A0A0C3EYY5_PILCF|nr:hypothetical protein PILCRDRAFT_803227 [Piloderma croceum F 1598]
MSTPTTTIAASTTTNLSSATTSCISAVPGKNGFVPPSACNALYSYNPSFAAAIIFTVISGIITGVHLIQAISYRKILLLLALLWINAFDYIILGRMVYYFLAEQNLFYVHATKFSVCFVWLDIVSFLVQATGGIILSGTNDSQQLLNIGKHIYMAGIGMQQWFISIFVILTAAFHRRSNNPIPYHDAFMYCLDSLPMALALYLISLVHPARTLVGPDPESPKLTLAEKKLVKQMKKDENVR